jgi:predicted unusual protein kinase regulating ubiquinone biosynthesis (AarF/ABC1/UbiB family)
MSVLPACLSLTAFIRMGQMESKKKPGKLSNPLVTAPAERGAIVRNTLDELGGVFIKLGQLLALRNDLFPPEF